MSIENQPHIGKTVIETLTSGMYEDARFIFREYIQNAADQIDVAVEEEILKSKNDGLIDVSIDTNLKRISVYDNATGISKNRVRKFLGDIANSEKDSSKRKGFRGIGRLGGLGYCEKLIFETSYKGENIKSIMTLDSNLLKKIIEDKNDKSDASKVVSLITSIEQQPEKSDSHYFKVTLDKVPTDKILDIDSVKKYLSMVAPLPFENHFKFTEKIVSYLEKNNILLDEYNVQLNSETLFKAYKNSFTDEKGNESGLIDVGFVNIYNDDQKLLAVCWFSYSNLVNFVLDKDLSYERGIRIRAKNIAIGDENTCIQKKFFDIDRTNLRFIGEIHTVNAGFIPNARRDYFNENETCQQFEKNVKLVFKGQNLENDIAQTASKLHNRVNEILKYNEAKADYKNKRGNFENENTESFHLNSLKILEKKAVAAEVTIQNIDIKANNNDAIRNLYNSIIGNKFIKVERISGDELEVSKYAPPTFSKLEKNKEAQNVILDIFKILDGELSFYDSENLKKLIIEKFNEA